MAIFLFSIWDFASWWPSVSNSPSVSKPEESPDLQSTHPDIVGMKSSWVLRHVLGQVCVLHEMAERLMLVALTPGT